MKLHSCIADAAAKRLHNIKRENKTLDKLHVLLMTSMSQQTLT